MQDIEIQEHEECKQLSLYSYDINKYSLPNKYKLLGIGYMDNGFYAVVTRKDNIIYIAFRGTDKYWKKPKDFAKDSDDDISMVLKPPKQQKSALDLVKAIKSNYPNMDIVLTGHSLGGSLAQMVAATIKGVKAVTFNAFGTKYLFNNENIFENQIINYCNPNDIIATARKHIGKIYKIESVGPVFKSHFLENMRPLSERVPVSFKDLKKKSSADDEYYQKTGKHSPIKMSGFGLYGEEKCSGKYPVSGYTKKRWDRSVIIY